MDWYAVGIMIKLNRLTDYAIVLLAQMALEGKGVCAASTLSEKTFLPLPTVSKVLKQLTKAGVLTAQRGAAGGYALGQEPGAISVAVLIEAMDGPITITDCAASGEEEDCCNVQATCPVRGNWNKVNTAVRAALEAVTLADMMADNVCPAQTRFFETAE
jgi:FeS assembly SUF system regulator